MNFIPVILTIFSIFLIVAIGIVVYKYFISSGRIKIMAAMYRHLIILVVASAVFGYISFDTHVMKTEATVLHGISSILFVSLLFLYGLAAGLQMMGNYILFITCYWGTGAFLYSFGYFSFLAPIFYPANFLFTLPVFGGMRFYFDLNPSFSAGIISIALLYLTCLAGYFSGKINRLRNISS